MALKWIESFGLYGNSTAALQAGPNWIITNYWSVSTTGGPYNGPYMTANIAAQNYSYKSLGGNLATFIVGFSVKNNFCFYVYDSGNFQIVVQGDSYGRLNVTRNSVTLGSITPLPNIVAWNFFEMKYTCNSSSGYIEIRWNGQTVYTYSGNTQLTANAYATDLGFNTSSNQGVCYANMYLCDTTGGAPLNDFLGDIRVDALMPTGEGATLNFTCSTSTIHYSLVNELPPNGDTNYVYSSTPGNQDLYAMADLATTPTSVLAVAVGITARKDDAGTRTLAALVKSGATLGTGGTFSIPTTFTETQTLFPLDPNTSAAWTYTTVNAMYAGVQVIA